MARPTARVLALLEILQGGGTRTVAELSRRLEVDERTVRRYVEHLLDLEIPVQSVRGRYGGYRLAAGYRMPPLMLTSDEALALLLGLLESRRAGGPTTAADAAAAKLNRVLPQQLARRLGALVQTTRFTGDAREISPPDTETLLSVAEAVRDERPLALHYVDSAGAASSRTVEPFGIVAHRGRWYLSGQDTTSGQLRTFRIDRIVSATPVPGRVEQPSPGFDPVVAVLTGLATAPQTHTVVVHVQGTVDEVAARFPPAVATLEPVALAGADDAGQDQVRVTIHADRLDWIPALLAGLGRPFHVEQPDALRALVLELAQRLAAGAGRVGRG